MKIKNNPDKSGDLYVSPGAEILKEASPTLHGMPAGHRQNQNEESIKHAVRSYLKDAGRLVIFLYIIRFQIAIYKLIEPFEPFKKKKGEFEG